MKHVKRIIIYLLCVLLFVDKLYALSFVKVDEDNNEITDAVFDFKTSNGKVLETIYLEQQSSVPSTKEALNSSISTTYNITYQFDTYEKVEELLLPEQKQIIDKMDTLDHFLSIKDIITIDPDDNYCTNKPGFVNFLKKSHGIFLMQVTQNTITLNIASGAELEEIRTPLGLEKLRALVGIGINLLYTIEADETLTLSNYETFYSGIYRYDENINYNIISDVYAKLDNSYAYADDCGNPGVFYYCPSNQTSQTDVQDNNNLNNSNLSNLNNVNYVPNISVTSTLCPVVLIDKKSTEDLSKLVEIKTYINGEAKTTLDKNADNIITVLINNKAKTPLYGNVVTSAIPKGLNLVNNSINNSGVYDEYTNTVKWEFNYLDALDSIKLSYKVSVPSDVSNTTVYKANAKLESTSLSVPTISNDATAGINTSQANNNEENPDTGDFRIIIAIVLFVISISTAVFAIRKNKIQEI